MTREAPRRFGRRWQLHGRLVELWSGRSLNGIFGQRYASGGNALGDEFRVNTYETNSQGDPAVASDASGNLVVVWNGAGAGDSGGIFGQRFDNGGNPLGGQFLVNTHTAEIQIYPSVASDATGNFVVVWDSRGQDGDSADVFGFGVFGQRFSAACEASVAVVGDAHTPGSQIPVQVHIAHHRPRIATVPWELRLLDADGQRIVRQTTGPHTFEPGDVVDRDVQFQLPNDLAPDTYTLELASSGMAGTRGATTTIRVVRSE